MRKNQRHNKDRIPQFLVYDYVFIIPPPPKIDPHRFLLHPPINAETQGSCWFLQMVGGENITSTEDDKLTIKFAKWRERASDVQRVE